MGYDKTDVADQEVHNLTPFVIKDEDHAGEGKKKITYLSSVVPAEVFHKIQGAILDDLAAILVNSFGPHGSNTCIKKLNAFNTYTKDGHTILSQVYYNGIIEQAIKDDIESITRNIVNTVGDGTTSAVLMSKSIFHSIHKAMEQNPDLNAADIMRAMDYVGKEMDEKIRGYATEPTLQDIYDIAYTSSNGDPYVAQLLYSIYETNGMAAFVDVAPTTAEDITVKMYDGMTIDSGFVDSCLVTNTEDNTSVVDNPEVYFFEDPIDTKEMGVLLDGILNRNIIQPMQTKQMDMITPTVIVCPKISRDMSSFLSIIFQYQNQMPAGNKLPITIIQNRTQPDQIMDIAQLCGAKMIFKYIDAEVYKNDLENGNAPTPENVYEWAGHCESVEASSTTTKFIHPSLMRDEDGNYTVLYQNILSFVESEIKKNTADGGDIHQVGTLKRRLHSLKSNLVEVRVGGMTPADRDAMLHLIEDAVKNCRSAAANGVGWGANFSGYLAIDEIIREHVLSEVHDANNDDRDPAIALIENAVYNCYNELIMALYQTRMNKIDAAKELTNSVKALQPINLRRMKYDGTVKSSIESDTIILNSVMKIVGMMVTCNQFIVPSAQHNVYVYPREV